MATLAWDWLKTALHVTSDFVTEGNPWVGISNDDQQGISCGILRWNIGQGSLQRLVKACGSAVVDAQMPLHGDELWQVCHQPISEGLKTVRAWQPGGPLKPVVLKELRALFGSEEMIAQQFNTSRQVGQHAFELASRWAADLRSSALPSLKEFCWFFDLVTQSISMNNVWLTDVRNFLAAHGREKANEHICEWMATRPPDVEHGGDAQKNAALWKNNVPDAQLELFVLTYLRSLKLTHVEQLVTMNRRGTIANTRGWVNGSLQDLVQLRNEPISYSKGR